MKPQHRDGLNFLFGIAALGVLVALGSWLYETGWKRGYDQRLNEQAAESAIESIDPLTGRPRKY